eukprot:1159245-Pelagomonas_calceolata.AAC.4
MVDVNAVIYAQQQLNWREAELKQQQQEHKDKLEGQGSQELDGEEEDDEVKQNRADKCCPAGGFEELQLLCKFTSIGARSRLHSEGVEPFHRSQGA